MCVVCDVCALMCDVLCVVFVLCGVLVMLSLCMVSVMCMMCDMLVLHIISVTHTFFTHLHTPSLTPSLTSHRHVRSN